MFYLSDVLSKIGVTKSVADGDLEAELWGGAAQGRGGLGVNFVIFQKQYFNAIWILFRTFLDPLKEPNC